MKTIVVPDVKKNDLYLKSCVIEKGKVYAHTRSYVLWKTINRRVSSEKVHSVFPNYKKSRVDFESFQEFAEWCNNQYGYMNKEDNGNYWSIEKDLTAGGVYNEKCLFVPNFVNACVLDSLKIRGGLPLGVVYRKKNKDMINELKSCYLSNIKKDGKLQHLGYFTSPKDAHRSWQKSKVEIIREYASREVVKSHIKLKNRLLEIARNIEIDYINGLETKEILCLK